MYHVSYHDTMYQVQQYTRMVVVAVQFTAAQNKGTKGVGSYQSIHLLLLTTLNCCV